MRRALLSVGLAVLATVSLTACSEQSPMGVEDHSAHFAAMNNGRNGAEIGTTLGWYDGKDITFHYNKPFFCSNPTASRADSKCILGEEPAAPPRAGAIPVVYVTVPLFTPTADYKSAFEASLQCPTAGACINHPSTIDLSPVFGEGTQNAKLPPHSHVIGDEGAANKGGWWEIEVVGITSQDSWKQLTMGKSLPVLREIQTGGGATGDIPTNLFLFFSANPSGK